MSTRALCVFFILLLAGLLVVFVAPAAAQDGSNIQNISIDNTAVSSANDTASQGVTVDPDQQPDPANFVVTVDSTNSPVTAGDDLIVNVTIENTGDQQGTQTVTLDAGSAGTDSAQVTLGGGESTTVSLVVSTSDNDTGIINASVDSADDSVTQGVAVRDPVQNVLVQGEITDKSLRNIETSTAERLEVTVTEQNTGRIIFQDVPFADFDDIEQNNALVDTADFIPGSPDQYVLELATFGADNQYRIEVEDPQNQFSPFAAVTDTLEPRQTDEQNIQLDRDTGDADVLVQGQITDKSLRNIETSTAERLEVTVTELESGTIIFQDVPFADFDDIEQNNALVNTANFIGGSPDQYVLELATFGADNQYRIEVEGPQNQFSPFIGDTATLEPNQTDEQNIQLARLINADRLTVLEPGERGRLETAIDNNNVPFAPGPESRDTAAAEFDATITVDTLVETQNSDGFGTSIGELAPTTDDTVNVGIEDISNPNAGGVTVNVDPSSSEAVNSEGFAEFGVSLTPLADPAEYTEPIDVELEFTAASDSSVSDTLTVTFVPVVEITGNVTNENNDDIPGATVLLFDADEVANPANLQPGDPGVILETNSGSGGAYMFTNVDPGNRYGIRAIALDSNGDRVSNTRELNNGNSVSTALGGEDIVVTGASPDQLPTLVTGPPQDRDGDGLYEDVRGDDEFNILDVQALFNNLDNPDLQNNAGAFKFQESSGSDEVTILDVQALFNELQE